VDSLLGRGSVAGSSSAAPSWTFLTNHLLVLLCVARDRGLRVRDIAKMVGITERSTQTILSDLEQDGYITREHIGRRTRYHVHPNGPIRHPLARSSTVGDLLAALASPSATTSATATG
jgi:predicted MarR family transcription regulator